MWLAISPVTASAVGLADHAGSSASSQAGAHLETCVEGRRGPEGSIDLERRKDSENSEARTSCTSIFLSLPEPIVKHTGEPGCPTISLRRCATLSPDASAPLTRRMVSPALIRPSQSAGPCRTTCPLACLSKDCKVVQEGVAHLQTRALSLPRYQGIKCLPCPLRRGHSLGAF